MRGEDLTTKSHVLKAFYKYHSFARGADKSRYVKYRLHTYNYLPRLPRPSNFHRMNHELDLSLNSVMPGVQSVYTVCLLTVRRADKLLVSWCACVHYKVHWKDYSHEFDTWEPHTNIPASFKKTFNAKVSV